MWIRFGKWFGFSYRSEGSQPELNLGILSIVMDNPHWQKGGVVQMPTTALLGEQANDDGPLAYGLVLKLLEEYKVRDLATLRRVLSRHNHFEAELVRQSLSAAKTEQERDNWRGNAQAQNVMASRLLDELQRILALFRDVDAFDPFHDPYNAVKSGVHCMDTYSRCITEMLRIGGPMFHSIVLTAARNIGASEYLIRKAVIDAQLGHRVFVPTPDEKQSKAVAKRIRAMGGVPVFLDGGIGIVSNATEQTG